MKIPYTLYIDDERLNLEQLQNLPDWNRYQLAFAKDRRLFKLPELQLFSQQVVQGPFFIDLIEIDAYKPRYIPLVIHDRQLFMCFMLKGILLLRGKTSFCRKNLKSKLKYISLMVLTSVLSERYAKEFRC